MTSPKPDWAALYLQHRDAMYAVARKVLRQAGHPDLADDAVHDVMAYVLSKPDLARRKPGNYLIRAARLRAMSIADLHDNKKGTALFEQDGMTDGIEDDIVQRLDLQHEILSLPEMQQRIIRQVIIEQRTLTEVAAELGLSKSRVSQLQRAALLTLGNRLGKGPIA